MKQKCPAELNSRVIRISLATYSLLQKLSKKYDLTIAETLDLLIAGDAKPKAITVVPRTQIAVAMLEPSLVVNGRKPAVLKTKPKGVRYG